MARALEDAAAEVERAHGVPVEVVTVGDRDLDPAADALVAAAREAMVNAAKFGGGHPVDVYAEAGPQRTQVFVRDRGPGFDPDAHPGRPPRGARVDPGPDGAPRRAGAHRQLARRPAPRSSWC